MYFQRYKCHIISYQNIWSINLCSRLYLVGLDIQVANQMSLITTFLHFEKKEDFMVPKQNSSTLLLPLIFENCMSYQKNDQLFQEEVLVCFSERVQKPLSFNGFCSDEIPYLQLAAVVNFKNVLSKRSCTKVLKGSKKKKKSKITLTLITNLRFFKAKSHWKCGM